MTMALTTVMLLAGCSAQTGGSDAASLVPTEHTPPSTTLEPSMAPTEAPTPQGTSSPDPTPFGTEAFEDPDDCSNEVDGYRVAFPEAWYTNAGFDDTGPGRGQRR